MNTPLLFEHLLIWMTLFLSIPLSAQQPLNLDFEKESVEGLDRPWGWWMENWGPVVFKMDSSVVQNGIFSLRSACDEKHAPCNKQSLRFGIESHDFKNQVITVTGKVKTRNLDVGARFNVGYTYFDVSNDNFEQYDTTSTMISGTADWTMLKLELLIPEKAEMVYIDMTYEGAGEAWFDDFRLFISGKEFQTVRVAEGISRKNFKWLKKKVCHLKSFSPNPVENSETSTDLKHFAKAVGESRIIALGEATHGTSEFFKLKHRLLQYAVEALGFRVFAIEDNQLAVEKVNEFVLTGMGDAHQSMQAMFAVWNTREVLEMVEWVRGWNERHPEDKVAFVGFDMQEITRPIDSLFRFLKQQDSELFNAVSSDLKDLEENGPNHFTIAETTKQEWFKNAEKALKTIEAKSSLWFSEASGSKDSARIEMGIQYARLVKQFAAHAFKGHWSLYRDEAMAENITWLLTKRFPDKKLVLWAHDGHISRGDHPNHRFNLNYGISMGSFLSKKYGPNYKAYSIATYNGDFLAQISYTNLTKIHCPLFPGPEGTLDEALHRVALKRKNETLFLNLEGARQIDWLVKPRPIRFANHVSIDYGFWERNSAPYSFDGIFFIDTTSPSTYLPKK